MRVRFVHILRSPEGGEGNGNTAPEPKAPDYSAELSRHKGDAAAMASALLAENATLRTREDKLKGDLAEARKLAPPAGSRVLSADEAKKLDAYLALGDPEAVRKSLDEGEAAAGKVRANDRKELLAEAAKPYGYSPAVLAKLAGDDLAIEVVEAKGKDGKPAKVAEVVGSKKGKDGQDVEERVALDEYAKQHWGDFLPSLAPKAEAPVRTTPTILRTEELASHQANGQPELIRSVF